MCAFYVLLIKWVVGGATITQLVPDGDPAHSVGGNST